MDMDIESTMRFILETQAKLEASAQEHNERIAANERQIQANTTQIGANAAHISRLVDVSLSLTQVVREANTRVSASIQELREAQAASEYKLNALIETVDKLVRRNGDTSKAPQP